MTHVKIDGAFIEYWLTTRAKLALVITTLLEYSFNLDPIMKFVQISKSPAGNGLQDFKVGNIIGCVHGIAEIATSSSPGDQ
jgi:hypothetical protein